MSSSPIELLLAVDRPVRVPRGMLCALDGVTWITECGRADDVFLRTGDRYVVRAGRQVLAEGVYAPSRVCWTPAAD